MPFMKSQPALWRLFVPLMPWAAIVFFIALGIWTFQRLTGH
jgi:hypothetical protein